MRSLESDCIGDLRSLSLCGNIIKFSKQYFFTYDQIPKFLLGWIIMTPNFANDGHLCIVQGMSDRIQHNYQKLEWVCA